jgi:hypothetical protein
VSSAESARSYWNDALAFVNLEALVTLNLWNNADKGGWESAYPSLTPAVSVVGGDGGEDLLDLRPVRTRYVKVLCKRRVLPQFGCSLFSLQVFDAAGRDLARDKKVSFSSAENGAYLGRNAVDGDETTRWSSEFQVDPQWITVDLGRRMEVRRMRLLWENAAAADYDVLVEDDAPPVAAIASPARGEEVSGTVDVSGTASDNVAVDRLFYRVDRGPWVPVSLDGGPGPSVAWRFSWDTSSVENGPHLLTVAAVDGGGNRSFTSAPVRVRNTRSCIAGS